MDDKHSYSDNNARETDPFLQLENPQLKKYRLTSRRWPWIAGTIVFGILSTVLLLRQPLLCQGDVETTAWRKSDFFGARSFVQYKDVLFHGNSAYDENGTFYVPYPSPVDYVGDPSPEVDAAWELLTGERDFLISESEAKALWGDDYKIHWHVEKKGYSIGLDMFHTLHCLNNLRKLYYPDYYFYHPENHVAVETHRGHCIDQIRQYIMCAGDMTAYGTRYYANPGRNYADSDVVHTCRDFNKLREYARNRYHAGGSLRLDGVEIWNEWRVDKRTY